MLKLLKIINSSSKGYWYIPEDSSPGLIEIDEKTGKVTIVIVSPYDVELGYPYYANKARGAIKRMWDKEKKIDNMPDEKFYAWG